ncbi:PDR/VanB family oxidoreductase [Rhodococcus globerulus]|uniref:PDR/VanB family oxidoreductase n=1 Tax=Rhodococcus globerulus TaxID=33008 RepID=A0ABU4C431_RHOGO|nr:PDR/VanB family oxidoreductase [Rhodococcus globerulus]MDV6271031.1 PDR/VanB family oxidoreductase [Rhodococcus globerulus]
MSESTSGMTATVVLDEPGLEMSVVEKTLLAPEIVSITLRPTSGVDLPTWEPGAHIDLVLQNGAIRQYSLCGSVADRSSYRVGVLRDPHSRGGSTFVHDSLQIGDTIEVRGPRNHFALESSKSYVFVAGGIGVTPMIPMAAEAQRAGADFTFLYCGRSRDFMGYLAELNEQFGERLVVNADDESGLFDLAGYFRDPRPDTMIYACGPARFLDATVSAASHWPSGSMHIERFEPPVVDESTNVEFEIVLASSGAALTVPEGQSILEVLRVNGVRVLSSCSEGTCGTCEVSVLSGGEEIDHRDTVLSAEEWESGEMMMVCVSRCRRGRLVLDL